MKNKLKKIRLTLSYTQEEFAKKLNCPLTTYRSYEYGSRNFSNEFIQSLINKFSVNANWLFCDIDEMFTNKCKNSLLDCNNQASIVCYQDFYKRLNLIQNTNKLSDDEFSEILGISEKRLEKLKNGIAEPDVEELNNLKKHFDLSIDWLLYGVE